MAVPFEHSKVNTISYTTEYWNCGYTDDDIKNYPNPHKVPIKLATPENLKGLGKLIEDLDKTEIETRQWPQTGKRPICKGTGIQAGLRHGCVDLFWVKDVGVAINRAVGDCILVTGRLPSNVSPGDKTHVLVREANYHPDGGQAFFSEDCTPFVALLAPPTDDVRPDDFTAFYFDGSKGLMIHPNVWHQPLYPLAEKATVKDKQGANFACVNLDTVKEFGKFLLVPLTLEG